MPPTYHVKRQRNADGTLSDYYEYRGVVFWRNPTVRQGTKGLTFWHHYEILSFIDRQVEASNEETNHDS